MPDVTTDESGGSILTSRKFVAYLIAEATWKGALILGLILAGQDLPVEYLCLLLAIVIVAGFVEAGFILGQASLDKYIRIAQIAVNSGKVATLGQMSVGHQPQQAVAAAPEAPPAPVPVPPPLPDPPPAPAAPAAPVPWTPTWPTKP